MSKEPIKIPTRVDLYKVLPPGWTMVEIGVCKGENASDILNRTAIKKLYLVDAWMKQTDYFDPLSDTDHEANLAECRHHLRGHPEFKRWEIVRGMSVDVAKNWTHGLVDAIYVDGDHSKKACLADLLAWEPHVKPGGRILGHDFTDNAQAKLWKFGVIEAVTEFCATRGWEITHLTNEDFASYMLRRVK